MCAVHMPAVAALAERADVWQLLTCPDDCTACIGCDFPTAALADLAAGRLTWEHTTPTDDYLRQHPTPPSAPLEPPASLSF